jgi:undecaprenyl diphosphate synthase
MGDPSDHRHAEPDAAPAGLGRGAPVEGPLRVVPRHVAIIMDGNGRWAQKRGLPRTAGHEAGAESVREVVRVCGELGVEVLTLYSFSTENWSRPEDEVNALMGLLERYLRDETAELFRNNVRLRGIGELDQLPDHVRLLLQAGQMATAGNTGMELLLALSYGGRAELVQAVRDLARDVRDGRLAVDDIDERLVASHLYTAGLPDPDLLIRTSGDLRVSNFLLWQIAYAELYVTPVPWPEFRRDQLLEAFQVYAARERRFGQTGDQVQDGS